jgi:hypothetical protein
MHAALLGEGEERKREGEQKSPSRAHHFTSHGVQGTPP